MLTPEELWLKSRGVEEIPEDPKERRELIRKMRREHFMEILKKHRKTTE